MAEKTHLEVLVPTSVELMGPAEAAYKDAIEVVIDCDEMRDVAVEERTSIRNRWNELENQRKALTKPLLDVKNGIDALFKPALDRLDGARSVLDTAILTYNAAAERKRKEEQARLEVAAKAEREKAEAEARRQAEEAEKLAQQAAQASSAEEAERLTAAAEEAQQNAAAAAVVAETIVAPVAVVESKMVGASERGTVDFELKDMGALITYVASMLKTAPHMANLLDVESVKMRAYVKTYGPDKENCPQIPGVKIFLKKSLSSAKKAA